MIGTATEERWTLIAEEAEGEQVSGNIGRVTITREAKFAFLAEAVRWLEDQAQEGFLPRGDATREQPAGTSWLATSYHGPTDSKSSCWMARADKVTDGG